MRSDRIHATEHRQVAPEATQTRQAPRLRAPFAALFGHVWRHVRHEEVGLQRQGRTFFPERNPSPDTPTKETVPLPKVAGGAASPYHSRSRVHGPKIAPPPHSRAATATTTPRGLQPDFLTASLVNAAPKVAGRSQDPTVGEASFRPKSIQKWFYPRLVRPTILSFKPFGERVEGLSCFVAGKERRPRRAGRGDGLY